MKTSRQLRHEDAHRWSISNHESSSHSNEFDDSTAMRIIGGSEAADSLLF